MNDILRIISNASVLSFVFAFVSLLFLRITVASSYGQMSQMRLKTQGWKESFARQRELAENSKAQMERLRETFESLPEDAYDARQHFAAELERLDRDLRAIDEAIQGVANEAAEVEGNLNKLDRVLRSKFVRIALMIGNVDDPKPTGQTR